MGIPIRIAVKPLEIELSQERCNEGQPRRPETIRTDGSSSNQDGTYLIKRTQSDIQ
jgi:hypothetical protein